MLLYKFKSKRNFKFAIFLAINFCCSLILGLIFKDKNLFGAITLFLGCSQIFFMTQGVWWEEIFGLTESLLTAIVCMFANLYGTVIFTVAIFVPLSIFSLVNWKKNQTGGVVKINKMTFKTSAIVVIGLSVAIVVVSFLLSLLPGQNLPVLDTLTNMLDLCAIILLALRYKEGWIFWILCSITDLVIWSLLFSSGSSENALMMIILSVIYIVMYLWGFISFITLRKKQEK